MRIKPDFWTGAERICWLCVFMEEFIGEKSLKKASFLLSGMNSIYNAPILTKAKQAIFNMRQISLQFTTETSIKAAINIYNENHYLQQTEGPYKISVETLEFERIDFLESPEITKVKQILNTPLEYAKHGHKFANSTQTMSVNLGEKNSPNYLPIEPIKTPLKPRQIHNFQRQPQGHILIPLAELKQLAQQMDKKEANYPHRKQENWEKRLSHFHLMSTENGQNLAETDYLELHKVKHLIGLPGAGKTTLLILIAVWLSRHNYKALYLFPSIEVARQYWTQLNFHGVKVGMLVGNSDQTRLRHANNIAEAIASSGSFAETIEGAELFGLNCPLPAFSQQDTSSWKFGHAPCSSILQKTGKNGKMNKNLCPLWTMCGRNKAPRELINANIWVGHVFSMDTLIPFHGIDEQVRYFEFIARTFDLIVFDEADLVQSNLDNYGAAKLSFSGSKDSIHRVIQNEIHQRFAKGENHYLSDRDVELYTRDVSEFGDHNTTLITTIQNLASDKIKQRYQDKLLTVYQIISDLLDGLKNSYSPLEVLPEEQKKDLQKNNLLASFWLDAAYKAFYNRTETEKFTWDQIETGAKILVLDVEEIKQKWYKLFSYFRNYLSENLIQKRDKIIEAISEVFLTISFPEGEIPDQAKEVIKLLVCVTFLIIGYQRIVPGTRAMIAQGLLKESVITNTPSAALRRLIPENILGSFSGVKYLFSQAKSTTKKAKNVEITYIVFMGSPRILMHRFHELFLPENKTQNPAILMTSATSFLEASPAYHINSGPHYLLKPEHNQHEEINSIYKFMPIPDEENSGQYLRYSGAGEKRNTNLEKMVDYLLKGGQNSLLYKAIKTFDVQGNIHRKAALIVNSYDQCRSLKKYINNRYPEIGKKTKALVKDLKDGESNTDYLTTAQCPLIGDNETCDILILPLLAIGRGVNIVFTKGQRKLHAAIGSIYFLTRPHPTMDDLTLLYSLATKASQDFDEYIFQENDDLDSMINTWKKVRKDTWKNAYRLLTVPLMASRLSQPLFKAFTANLMVDILQTIGRGMRNSCPVQVFFVDAAWSYQSALGNQESSTKTNSMLVQIRVILEECLNNSDPIKREIYSELYGSFLTPLRKIKGVNYPDNLTSINNNDKDDFDDYTYDYLEM